MSAAAIASYVPRLLSHRLAAGEPLAGPEARRLSAAVLLTDIEGFTSLVEAAGASRRQGLEELASALNAYFSDLVEVVYGHGGDVLSIAGDAFFSYWPAAGPEHLADAALRATQAAREIQRRLHGRPVVGDRRFGTRAGVGAGELTLAFVGGLDARWEIIASGGATAEVAAVEPLAAAGEVVLSPGAWSLLATRCSGRRQDAGCVAVAAVQQALTPEPSPPRPAIADTEIRLRPYLSPAVLARNLAPGTDWLAELRRVTVLLAEVPDLGDASPQALQRTHQTVRAIQEIVKRYEGTARMDIDNKGVTALAVFGLPPLAHENDAQRALEAAHALEERWRTLGVASRIGVATGRAFCGAFGSDLRREYMVRGDVINLAARLMRTQTSTIVCDHDTSHAAGGRIVFESLGQVALKGRAAAVEVYRPVGRREDQPVAADPLIGRTRERALLAKRLQAFHERGESGVLIVEGEPGLGKTRLVAELSQMARAAHVRVLTAAADAIESSTAYFAWRPVFTTLFRLTPADDPVAARRRISERMADLPDLARLVPLLGSVLPVPIPDNDLTAEMTGDVRAENTRLLLARILAAAAQAEATLLIIEDAHWLDSSSWALLLEVVRSVQPLLAVVAARPPVEGVPGEREQLARMSGTQVLRLDGLTPDETLALMRRCLGVSEVPDALARIVQERVAGHPFFCQELIQTMLEAGSIRVEGGTCVVGDVSEASLPTTIEGVILSRLDRLTPGQQLCLKVGAVVGRVFHARTIRETHPIEHEREHIAEHLDALARLELTVRESAGPDPTFAFKHVITRDVTYELMTLAQRQPLHRAVAEWYERNHAADLTPHYALLAHHWSSAGDSWKTVDYLERAGEQARRGGAFEEALRFYTQAMEIQDAGGVPQDGDRRAIWEKGVGTAHYFLGDLTQSRGRL
ncbi:MAG: AAA family ATPase, partial [Gemmatimonadetes bacterium]|nr:AAA family ATPase [Gemmatimonadota bacterium]